MIPRDTIVEEKYRNQIYLKSSRVILIYYCRSAIKNRKYHCSVFNTLKCILLFRINDDRVFCLKKRRTERRGY